MRCTIAYHGTRNAKAIKASGLRVSTGGEFGPGIYLTESPHTARFYASHVARGPEAPKVLPFCVTLANPFRVQKTDWIKMTERSSPGTVQRRLARKGYDGIIGVGLTGEEQIVAWRPEQVTLKKGR